MNHLTRELLAELAEETAPEPAPVPEVPDWDWDEPDYEYRGPEYWQTSHMCPYDGLKCAHGNSAHCCTDDLEDEYAVPPPPVEAVFDMYETAHSRRQRVLESVLELYDTTLIDTHIPVLKTHRIDVQGYPIIRLNDYAHITLLSVATLASLRITSNMEGLIVLTYDQIPEEVFEWEMIA